jgi:hypothetical protein
VRLCNYLRWDVGWEGNQLLFGVWVGKWWQINGVLIDVGGGNNYTQIITTIFV